MPVVTLLPCWWVMVDDAHWADDASLGTIRFHPLLTGHHLH
jgi:hypothetical protein